MSRREAAILALDLGTSDLKAGLVTTDGRVLAATRITHHTTVDSRSGGAEQDAEEWWRAIVGVTRELLTGVDADVIAVCADGHGPTLVAVDADCRPVRAAITWLDSRSKDEHAPLAEATGQSGWRLGVTPAARWLERTRAFFRLTGGFIVKTAMRMVMMTMSRRRRDLGFIISHKHAEHTLNR